MLIMLSCISCDIVITLCSIMRWLQKKDRNGEKEYTGIWKAKNAAVREKAKKQFFKGFFPLRYSLIQFV